MTKFVLQKPENPSQCQNLELWWDGVKLPVRVQSIEGFNGVVAVTIAWDNIDLAGPGQELRPRMDLKSAA